jgi:CheY-specific phosphatase CheX
MDRTKQIWVTSIFEVFEKMFYIFLEQVEIGGHYDMTAQISFRGPRNGRMRFFFPDNFARTMAMNMLNMEPDEITPVIVEDCLKESANMICGNFLRKFDTSQVFDLGLPQLAKKTGEIQSAPDSDCSISAAFESDGEGFSCILTFQEEDAVK